jgi:hypothetical protein
MPHVKLKCQGVQSVRETTDPIRRHQAAARYSRREALSGLVCGGFLAMLSARSIAQSAVTGVLVACDEGDSRRTSADTPVRVYFDDSASMRGFVAPASTIDNLPSYRRVVEGLTAALESTGPVQRFRFAGGTVPVTRVETLSMFQTSFYHAGETRIDRVIEQSDATSVAVIVTDFLQNGDDVDRLLQAIKDGVIAKGAALAIVAARVQFHGEIDRSDLGGTERGSIPYVGAQPLYWIAIGEPTAVRRLACRAGAISGIDAAIAYFARSSADARNTARPMRVDIPNVPAFRSTALLAHGDPRGATEGVYRAGVAPPISARARDGSIVAPLSIIAPAATDGLAYTGQDLLWSLRWEQQAGDGHFASVGDLPATAASVESPRLDAVSRRLSAQLKLTPSDLSTRVLYRLTIDVSIGAARSDLPTEWRAFNLGGAELDTARAESDPKRFAEVYRARTPNLGLILLRVQELFKSGATSASIGRAVIYLTRMQ